MKQNNLEIALLQAFALKNTQRRIVPGGVVGAGAWQVEVCGGMVGPYNGSFDDSVAS